jgi:riboflavin kinase / FMN adenylyltransferase
MKVIHRLEDWQPRSQRACVAIGVFDGVHLGHQQIIRQTIADARQHGGVAVVVTFDRHPSSIVAPERVPPLIHPLASKLATIDSLGIDELILIRFDEDFSRLPGETFVRRLAAHLKPLHGICVGGDFVFGYRRSGNVKLLQQLGGELGFVVHGYATVSLDGQVISSTRIRECIRAGNLEAASQLLGRPYSLSGQIVAGDHLGRELGFPTANLDVTGLVLPPNGVYAVMATCREQNHRAVLNIGHRPTVRSDAPELRAEVHLLDFSAELYGCQMHLSFFQWLREERRFDSLAALKEQIPRDIAQARRLF